MTSTSTEPRICACGCGEEVVNSRAKPGEDAWKRGHKMRGKNGKLTLLPGPADDLDAEDDIDGGEISGGPEDEDEGPDIPAWLLEGDGPPAPPEAEIPEARPPGRMREPRGKREQGKARHKRPSVTVQKDVHAKIRIVLMPLGQVWQLRDQPCGGTFVQQEPFISEALAEIVCDSPDLLAWFTGPMGGFMKYFKLLLACQPVALMFWAHHVTHGQILGDPTQPAQQPAFAA